ncbi:hypothetical protein [Vulgatibacter sp.]|uniref:hypothetical protein n=1 Tax=Vulgatibacter sp. TaxID=1971226 RepID=UPI003569635D
MKIGKLTLLLGSALLAACGTGEEDPSSLGSLEGAATDGGRGNGEHRQDGEGHTPPGGGAIGEDCIKFEDEEIGAAGLGYDFGGSQITIDSWLEKDDSPGEQIGFAYTVVGDDLDIRVKTGGEVWESTLPVGTGSWSHPSGLTAGPEAPAISHIVFCGDGEDTGAGGSGGEGGAGGAGGSGGAGGAGGSGTGGSGGIILM